MGTRQGRSAHVDCEPAMTITVYGLPAPAGSKRFVGHAKSGRGILVESSKQVRPWREAVKWAALLGPGPAVTLTGPLLVEMTFTLPRPKTAPKGRRWPDSRPDLSKLERSTEDALTDAGVWQDDARLVRCLAMKVYVGAPKDALDRPGAVIEIAPA